MQRNDQRAFWQNSWTCGGKGIVLNTDSGYE